MSEAELQTQIVELKAEIDALRSEDPDVKKWFYARKAIRQTAELDRMHSRIVNQRFQLRTLNELGRGLTKEEWLAARDQLDNEQLRDRIGEPVS